MRSAFIAALLVLIPFGSVAQESPLKPDGRMWQVWSNSGSGTMPTLMKAAYVQGAIEGLRVGSTTGYYKGRLDEKSDALDYVKSSIEKEGPSVNIPLANLVKRLSTMDGLEAGASKIQAGYTARHASALDIVHQMDKFYADYRNTSVCLVMAIQESIASLNGNASSEEALNMERKGCNP